MTCTCIFKHTKRSKYVYSLLIFNESQMPVIEFTKTIRNGTIKEENVIRKKQARDTANKLELQKK